MKLKTLIAILAFSSGALSAQTVEIKDAWARATVPGQKASGAFMKITAKEDAQLVGLSSPVAGVVELHEMKMEADVMRMRAVAGGLSLPAGKTLELKPGGYHVMLMDLKVTLTTDGTVPLTLV
ncbi:MAG: copper chaperone PCu(A)C, partial [Hylemonella sp.]